MQKTMSPRTKRQTETYATLIPALQSQGVLLSERPSLAKQTLANADACRGPVFHAAARQINKWIEADDYGSLLRYLTDPSDVYEPLRVVSPLISTFWQMTAPRKPRINRESITSPVRG